MNTWSWWGLPLDAPPEAFVTVMLPARMRVSVSAYIPLQSRDGHGENGVCQSLSGLLGRVDGGG